jgi:hypothetical protein
MTPFAPTDHCPSCGNIRPYHHPCPCGDPGGMPRTLPADHEAWKPSERRLYANAAIRVLGEEDTAGRLLCQVMDGPLAGENRWFTVSELYATGQDAAADAQKRPQPAGKDVA